jgi:hypothetical protein
VPVQGGTLPLPYFQRFVQGVTILVSDVTGYIIAISKQPTIETFDFVVRTVL